MREATTRRWRDRPFALPDRQTHWRELGERVEDMATPHGAFYLLVVLATTIAAFGLLADSTAVVIGAMLVAPLMGPIFGVALGLAVGNTTLLGDAIRAEVKGLALAVVLGAAIGWLVPHGDFGGEVLARTRPTVYDVVVALASGLAGAFALTDRRVSPALPGVAIATAIVPPLATVGLCLSAGRLDLAGGAFLLFLANLVAIELAAVAWFTVVGVREGHLHEHFRLGSFLRHFGPSLGLLLVIGAFMTHTLLQGIAANRQLESMRGVLARQVRLTQGARVEELQVEQQGDTLHALAVVMSPQEFRPEQVARIEDSLRVAAGRPTRLVMRSVLSRDVDRAGAVFVSTDEVRRQSEAEQQTRLLARASEVLRERFRAWPGVELEEIRRERRETLSIVTAVVRTPWVISPEQVASLNRDLGIGLDEPVLLVVRSVIARDADPTGYLHEAAAPPDSAATPEVTPPDTARTARPRRRVTG